MSKLYKVIDLFSGCGGFSYGFQQAGFEVILGVDNDEKALETFKVNHRNSETCALDLYSEKNIRKIAKTVQKFGRIDVIIAGPPCQGFSLTGTRNEKDKRNSLSRSIFKLVEILKKPPKAIVIENVPGLGTLYNGKAKSAIEKDFKRLGYNCSSKILYAPEYGVPQIRRRLFMVGIQKKLGNFEFPRPVLTKKNFITCEQAIADLPSLENDIGSEVSTYSQPAISDYQKKMRGSCDVLHNHLGTKHTEHVISVISQVPEGGNYKDLPPGVGGSRKFNEAWTRYHSKKPSKTIDTGHRNHFHYKYNRVPSIRENARLQSFPDEFIFLGSKTHQNKQVGNAVPPLLGFHIANTLKTYLRKK